MTPTISARIVFSTTGSMDEASRIARILVEEQLAACVNILSGIRSIYRWQGTVHDDGECMLVIKTTLARLGQLESRLKALHSYENPEFLVLVPESGSADYMLWMDQSVSEIVRKEAPSI